MMNQEKDPASEHNHEQGSPIGILIANLGTPDAPTAQAVRRYLREFLSDPRVIELPRWLWLPILHLVILNTRPRRSAQGYARVWTSSGSPLMAVSKRQQAALQTSLEGQMNQAVKVELGMRYGTPSIAQALTSLRDAGARHLLILPLYPQYSATTTASIYDAVSKELKHWRWLPELRFIHHYHDDPRYISALANSIKAHWDTHGQAGRLLLSFHGIPEEFSHAGDPYFHQCHRTGHELAAQLGLSSDDWCLSFQSRLGPKQWLNPYTDQTLSRLAKEGVKRVDVICPGFSADCLETLDEISNENRAVFLNAGGEIYHYIPCLNDQKAHIEALTGLIRKHCQGWTATVQIAAE